jgi:hypothetical protein
MSVLSASCMLLMNNMQHRDCTEISLSQQATFTVAKDIRTSHTSIGTADDVIALRYHVLTSQQEYAA